MKRTTKYALLAASALAVAASAQAAYRNGDLLAGFTGVGTTDFIYDLGPSSSLSQGQTWAIGAGLGTTFGIVGAQTVGQSGVIWATQADPSFASSGLDVTLAARQGKIGVAALGFGLNGTGSSWTPGNDEDRSWNMEANQAPGGTGNTLQNQISFSPTVDANSTAFFYSLDSTANTITYEGHFSYDSGGGTLTYVPEPTSFSLLGGFGLLGLAARRKLFRV